ncbi:MAG: peptidase M14 [Caldilineae bacterium]|nr:MAG: peptidase M14 [Caldilineae bacterium]
MGEDPLGRPMTVPVLVKKGEQPGPVLGVVAAIHGNELNGIAVLHRLFQELDTTALQGTLVGVPGLNPPGLLLHQRAFFDGQDLNRLFPGRPDGNEGQQWAHAIAERLLPHFDLLIDLHTASFGRENTFYVRADMQDSLLAVLAAAFQPDLILHSEGAPSAGGTGRTLRAQATENGIPTLTLELGNPQIFQPEMVRRGLEGLRRVLIHLDMLSGENPAETASIPVCRRSFWLYTDRGGWLEVLPELGERVRAGAPIAHLRNAFGDVIQTYTAPEAGIVIGRSSNPAAAAGARILHLGVF